MSDIYERIAASTPVDRTASRVAARGVHYTPTVNIDCPHWEACPKLGRRPQDVEDLSGQSLGRFTVVGFLRMTHKGPSWVVRCACGAYETRQHRAIKRQADTFFGCRKCHREKYVRDRQFFDAYGRWPSSMPSAQK